jgi:UDP-GlcNAc:undecaprenyl-phosphate/decaprenyl-phosphate GlcNAc-1-phosphate transferase
MLTFISGSWQALLLAFIGAVMITWFYMPRVIRVASKKSLTDKPGKHKIHRKEIPNLGGIGIFGGFSFGFLMAVDGHMQGVSYFMAALIILFFTGLKDDLINIKPYKKIGAQVLAALILCTFSDLRFTNFHGFLGITVIPLWLSYLTTVFLMVIMINSLNLVDGIDGLAGSVGIIASATFGIWSFLSDDLGFAIMSAALTGTLIIFLFYNLSQGKNKIFMGDTGSMVIGLIITVMAIRFNETNAYAHPVHHLVSSPAISIAILIVPLFDTLRVIVIRLIRGQGVMVADNRHIHHLLLRAGFTHAKATAIIAVVNVNIIAVAFFLDHLGIILLSFILLIMAGLLTMPAYILVARKEHWNWKGYNWLKFHSEETLLLIEMEEPKIGDR